MGWGGVGGAVITAKSLRPSEDIGFPQSDEEAVGGL